MKIVYGYLLIIFSLLFMIIIAFPQFYSTNSSGRIDKSIPLKFNFLEQESSPVVLLFFGYVGCGDICPPAMQELNNIYTTRPFAEKSVVKDINILLQNRAKV